MVGLGWVTTTLARMAATRIFKAHGSPLSKKWLTDGVLWSNRRGTTSRVTRAAIYLPISVEFNTLHCITIGLIILKQTTMISRSFNEMPLATSITVCGRFILISRKLVQIYSMVYIFLFTICKLTRVSYI
jgi:hypothetical protein